MSSYLNDKSITFRLRKYIYGLHESPSAFNQLMNRYSIGFQRSKADPCLYFIRETDGMYSFLTLHVDDMLLASSSKSMQQWFESSVQSRFSIMSQYDDISYLSMSISQDKHGNIVVNQIGFIDKLVAKYAKSSDTVLSSTSPTFLKDSPGKPISQKEYLGLVMSLMYLSRFSRPDLLFPTSYLATKSSNPTSKDYRKAHQILMYAKSTRSLSLKFLAKANLHPIVYTDTSHILHRDGKGQGGIFITLGSAPIMTKSFKLKLVTRSSTESELIALEEACTYALWLSTLLQDLQLSDVKRVTIANDNKSTLHIAKYGGNFSNSKHIINRQQFVSQYLSTNDITLVCCPTDTMPGDMLTKPKPGPTLIKLCKRISITDK
jgi:hypothetical protein